MSKGQRQTSRKPATKFAHLRKKMQKQKVQIKQPRKEVSIAASRVGSYRAGARDRCGRSDKPGRIFRPLTFNSSKIGRFYGSCRGSPARENSSPDHDDQGVHKLLIQAPVETSHSWTVNVPPTR
jgi:hypothetical protein